MRPTALAVPGRSAVGSRSGIRMPYESKVVWLPGDVRSEIHLTGEHTADDFCLSVDHPPPGWRLPTHYHASEAETILVLEGRFEVDIGGQHGVLGPGDVAHIPA